ncbi:MAG: hypothetical protein UT69_C0037G0009 [Candidatus Yanofskybacteria bacterium GW2011_GWE1_40_10]|nr:MAG: hypothetical protein UT69_C0037G0009 [Candidatus Yanofskybacteria bacterium GW2011_GWE1_40_10]
MNETIVQALGFTEELGQIKLGNCPFCRKPIHPDSFRDMLSAMEFQISGLCQACQDEVFA